MNQDVSVSPTADDQRADATKRVDKVAMVCESCGALEPRPRIEDAHGSVGSGGHDEIASDVFESVVGVRTHDRSNSTGATVSSPMRCDRCDRS